MKRYPVFLFTFLFCTITSLSLIASATIIDIELSPDELTCIANNPGGDWRYIPEHIRYCFALLHKMENRTEQFCCLHKLGNFVEKRILVIQLNELLPALTQTEHCAQESSLSMVDKYYICDCLNQFRNCLLNGEFIVEVNAELTRATCATSVMSASMAI